MSTNRSEMRIRLSGGWVLQYTATFGTFVVGETVTGGTSGATATVDGVHDVGGTLYLRISNIVGGPFGAETITGGTSGATGLSLAAEFRNNIPALSLGGEVGDLTFDVLGNATLVFGTVIGGVTGVSIHGLNETEFALTHTLEFDPVGAGGNDGLRFQRNGDTFGPFIDVSVDGRYSIPSGDDVSYICVDVVAASLPGVATPSTIDQTLLPQNVFDDVTAVEAFAGDTEYRCLYFHNTSATDTVTSPTAYRRVDLNAPTLAMGLDLTATNGDGITTGVAATIPDEDTGPSGVGFSSPTSAGASTIIMQNLAPGEMQSFWLSRAVPVTTPLDAVDFGAVAIQIAGDLTG